MRNATTIASKCYLIHIQGLVQGVGFRPFVYRMAQELNLKGWVKNNNQGVYIKVHSDEGKLEQFKQLLVKNAPQVAKIDGISVSESLPEEFKQFSIVKSSSDNETITQVSPDIAVCPDCLSDIKQQPHRIKYPLTNCTHCGPRFSIIKSLPYDRPNTTMKLFTMCKICHAEYTDVLNRRFHAQPIACSYCGPVYKFISHSGNSNYLKAIISEVARGIESGKIYAIKGMGGYNLVCDAFNQQSVERLRQIKHRESKPFAVMTSGISSLKKLTAISQPEEQLLQDWRRSIVLVDYNGGLVKSVTNGLNTLGVLLPYMPFHYLLFEKLKTKALVFTSGNLSDEPIIIDDTAARETFLPHVEGIVSYNRDIYNRVDDSVCKLKNGKTQVLRRSRGYAPEPVQLNFNSEGLFAAGAELTGTFCIGKNQQAILSQYLGDIKNMETLAFYEEAYHRFSELFRFKPKAVAVDYHPDYLSSQFGEQLAQLKNIPVVKVQHHHAHIASAMASCGLNQKVIGVSFDGTGLGTDGKIWGGEFMVADYTGFERFFHFEYTPMPGGDKAAKEPWRMAIAYLYQCYGKELFTLDLPLLRDIEPSKVKILVQLLDKNINVPQTSSAGRLFDAVAAITGIAYYNGFQAEAPMRLESDITANINERYSYRLMHNSISLTPTIKSIVEDIQKGKPTNVIAVKFHQTIVEIIVDVCVKISDQTSLKTVVLSGGTFQNSYLIEHLYKKLNEKGLEVYMPDMVPVNDQGIALGQLAIAAHKLKLD